MFISMSLAEYTLLKQYKKLIMASQAFCELHYSALLCLL